MPTPRKSLFDHYLDAVRLLARAEVHLEFYARDNENKPHTLEIINNLRSDIDNYLKKKVPQ